MESLTSELQIAGVPETSLLPALPLSASESVKASFAGPVLQDEALSENAARIQILMISVTETRVYHLACKAKKVGQGSLGCMHAFEKAKDKGIKSLKLHLLDEKKQSAYTALHPKGHADRWQNSETPIDWKPGSHNQMRVQVKGKRQKLSNFLPKVDLLYEVEAVWIIRAFI